MSNGSVSRNPVVGNYDIVVQFSLFAVDRFLAVMHECERFLHSVSGYINDVPPPQPHLPPIVLTGAEDAYGKAVVNQQQIQRKSFTGTVAANDFISSSRGGIVNPGGVLAPPTNIPSNLSGIVQLQISPPTIDVPDASGKTLSVTMNAMARYFPDIKTAPIAQFLRGNLQVIAPINQISTELGNVIEFDFKVDEVLVTFTPTYTSSTLSAEDYAAINLAMRNALKTSFHPSSATLPGGISALQFKTLLSGSQKAAALLLNLTNRSGDPASVQDVFLNPADDFGFAISPGYINSLFSSALGQLTTFPPINVSEWPFSTTYTITLTSPPALNLATGQIQVIVNAHARGGDFGWPSFNFTTTVAFTLNLIPIDAQGRLGAAELALAKVSLDFTDSGLGGDIKDAILGAFRRPITDRIAAAVSNVLNPANPKPTDLQPAVRSVTNIDTQLGKMVNSLLTRPNGDEPDGSLKIQFAYTSVDIQPMGVILRGSKSVHVWADPYVEFDQVPSQPSGGTGPGHAGNIVTQSGTDYTALNTWIPGGTITQYEWSIGYQNQLYPFGVDPNKFVLLHSGPATEADAAGNGLSLPPYTPLRLTVRGMRISPSGSGPAQQVSASASGYHHLPIPGVQAGDVGAMPTIAMTQPGPDGHIVVTGHAAAQTAALNVPNLLVHFADGKSAAGVKALTEALQNSKRGDAPTVVMAVAPQGELAKLDYTPGIIYAEDDATWERAFGLEQALRPLTVVVDPAGNVVWQHKGLIEQKNLTSALAKHLSPTAIGPAKLMRLKVRLGQPAPNFLFEYAPGRETTLSKLKGRPVTLVFSKAASQPSIEAVRDLQERAVKTGPAKTLVLGINDGGKHEAHRTHVAASAPAAIQVPDPKRAISGAYGVTAWPTIVSIDAAGRITGIGYGYSAGEHVQS